MTPCYALTKSRKAETVSELVLVDRPADGVAVVTLNRPEARNALSVGLREAASNILRGFANDDSIGAVVLTGAGAAFSAGVDLKEISNPGGAPKPSARGADDLAAAVVACPVPVIAAVNGIAVTGGLELLLACDVILASADARFADTHARLGIMPSWGITQRLPRLIGMSRAKQMSLTGNYLDAETAERWGLVNEVVPAAALLARAIALASEMASCDRRAVRNLKRAYDEGSLVTMAEGFAVERAHAKAHLSSVRPEDIGARTEGVKERGRRSAG